MGERRVTGQMARLLRASVFASVLACVVTGFAAQAQMRAFQHWSVGCDNGGRCTAIGFAGEYPSADTHKLAIVREASGRMLLRFWEILPAPYDVFVDGKSVARVEQRHVQETRLAPGAEAHMMITDQAIAATIVRAAAEGGWIGLGAQRQKDKDVSLAGVKAALLFMDEVQKLAGTRLAFVARGNGKAALRTPVLPLVAVPAFRSKNALADSAKAAVIDHHKRTASKDDCSELERPDGLQVLESAEIEPGRFAVAVSCWRAAYQSGEMVYITDATGKSVQRAMFERYEQKNGGLVRTSGKTLTLASIGPGGQASEFAKGRGLGDCGEASQWRWDGRMFRLAGHRYMPRCAGILLDDWFELWRVRGK